MVTERVQELMDESEAEVAVVSGYPNPCETVVRQARQDKMDGWQDDFDFETLVDTFRNCTTDTDESVEYTETRDEAVRRFIGNMQDRCHWGPFEHQSITFSIKGGTRGFMQQLVRHRHATYDIQSTRYIDMSEAEVREPERLVPGTHTKSGEVQEDSIRKYRSAVGQSFERYQELLEKNVPKEVARGVLPINMKVNIGCTFNARTLFHLGDMRMSGETQNEFVGIMGQMWELAKEWFPEAFEYYEENWLGEPKRLPP